MWRRTLLALVLALPIASVPVVHELDLLDDRLREERAERLIQQRLGTRYGFECTAMDEDGSLAIPHADYYCSGGDAGYWIGTDEERITEIQSAG
jgi:hypothetical protein